MKLADGFEPGAVIGPLIDMKAVEKVEAHIADAVKKGPKVVTGGKLPRRAAASFETVLTDVTTDMVITKEETFGPVAPLFRFKTEEDAVEMASDTPALPLRRRRRGAAAEGWVNWTRPAECGRFGVVGLGADRKKPVAGGAATGCEERWLRGLDLDFVTFSTRRD